MTEIASLYDKLQQKHGLPSYEEMNKEYEIGELEEDDLLIRNVRKKVKEKFEYLANVLSNIIQPDTDLSDLHEVSFFDDPQKEEIILVYKKLMYYTRYSARLVVEDSDEENAEYIKEAHAELQRLKPQLKKIFDQLRESWKKDLKKTVDAAYFG